MSLVTLQNNDLYFELSSEMGASVTKFQDKKSGKDIFSISAIRKEAFYQYCKIIFI